MVHVDNYLSKVKEGSSDRGIENAREELEKDVEIDEIIETIRKELKDKELSFKARQGLRKELSTLIKSKSLVKFDNGEPVEFHITYDTFSTSLEPVYFWTLDFLRSNDPSGLGFEVEKVGEEFEATAGGGFFGELGSRATVMQERAMNVLGKINDILRTIINLIYDLREFDMRLQAYKDANSDDKNRKEAGEYSLRGIWMDQVDVKMGLGSINQLTRGDLQFVTLRDAFMQARGDTLTKALHDVDNDRGGMDLNKRVKVILKKKLEEYFAWRTSSGAELEKRYQIERNYLRSQVDSLRLYTKWARPYLRAAQKLGMKEFKTKRGLPSPDMVTTFNSMQMELQLMGKKSVNPSKAHDSYSNLKFSTNYNASIEVQFFFRSVPQVIKSSQQGQHYAQMGTIDVWFRAYCFTDQDLDDIYAQEVYEDMALVEELTDMSLENLQYDLDEYLCPEKFKKNKESKKEELGIFSAITDGISSINKGLKKFKLDKIIPSMEKKAGNFEHDKFKKVAQKVAMDNCYVLYDVFKKSHRMVTW